MYLNSRVSLIYKKICKIISRNWSNWNKKMKIWNSKTTRNLKTCNRNPNSLCNNLRIFMKLKEKPLNLEYRRKGKNLKKNCNKLMKNTLILREWNNRIMKKKLKILKKILENKNLTTILLFLSMIMNLPLNNNLSKLLKNILKKPRNNYKINRIPTIIH